MDKEKQIEEMAKVLCEDCARDVSPCFLTKTGRMCNCVQEQAEALYNAGYRKSEDVAREIFEEIEKSIADLEYSANTPRKTVKVEELKAQCDWILHEVIPKTLAELKKKYTESEKDK